MNEKEKTIGPIKVHGKVFRRVGTILIRLQNRQQFQYKHEPVAAKLKTSFEMMTHLCNIFGRFSGCARYVKVKLN